MSLRLDTDKSTSPPPPPPPPVDDDRPLPGDRRRRGWRDFRHAYPGVLATMGLALVILLAMDAWLLYKRRRYDSEIERLRSGMTDVERRRTDMALKAETNRFQVTLELIRRQALIDKDLHLSVSVDSSVMYLEQGGAQLRVMPVQVGAEATVGTPPDTVRLVAPRGKRTVERILGASDSWEVPRWVYQARGLAVPGDRTVKGALGPAAIILNGGTIIYSMPSAGPLNDSSFVLPGSMRARASDLKAVLPNLKRGQSVYFY